MYICENCQKEHNGTFGSGRFCSNKCAKGFSTKAKRSLINEKVSKKRKENIHLPVIKQCHQCHEEFKIEWRKRYQNFCSRSCSSKFHANTPERKKIASESMKYRHQINDESIGKGGTRGKQGWYKGIWCDSSWELAWVIYHLDHNIKFKRNKEGFEYYFKNKKHKYYPDFIFEDNTFIEIKGRRTIKDLTTKEKIKINHFKLNNKLLLLFENNMIPILEYVKLKYGDNFINLYERWK